MQQSASSDSRHEPLNVLVLHWGRNNAGPRLARDMAASLAKSEGLDVHISYSRQANSVHLFHKLGLKELPVTTFRSRRDVLRGALRFPTTVMNTRRYIRQNDIDVIVSPMLSIWQSLSLPFIKTKGVKYLAGVHDAVLHAGDQSLLLRLTSWLDRRYADTLVVFSQSVAEQLRPRLRKNQAMGVTVLGAFTAEFDVHDGEVQHSRTRDHVRVGMLGRLGPYKGVDIFVDAIAVLKARGYEIEAVVHGQGGEDVVQLAKSAPHVTWHLGWIPESEVNAIVRGFDVLALPYREASQSGVVAIALSESVPMAVTPVGALPEQVVGAGAGVVSRDLSPDGFADALEPLIQSSEYRQRLGDSGKRAADTQFAWSRVARDLREMMESPGVHRVNA